MRARQPVVGWQEKVMSHKVKRKLTTFQIAQMLEVSDQSVSNWIDSGQLAAERTPGGHRRVEREDLIGFLRQHQMGIPPELVIAPPAILIVDDEQDVARWIGKMLGKKFPQCRILMAHDGFAAGKTVTAERPQVVILDLFMPGMDGFEVCRRIKSDPQTHAITVIAITAHPSKESEKSIRDAGAEAYLAKPIDVDSLYRLVKASVSSEE